MSKRDTPFLLCETICDAVQQSLPEAMASGSNFFFDYEGHMPIATVDSAVVRTLVDRLLRYTLKTFSKAGIFFRVKVAHCEGDVCRVLIRVAAVSQQEPPGALGASAAPDVPDAAEVDLDLVHVLCRSLNGNAVRQAEASGIVVEADFRISVLAPSDDLLGVTANGAAAWLVGSPPFAMKMLARRFQRLGWQIRLFDNVAEVETCLADNTAQAPALVIGSMHRGVTKADMKRLRETLPADTRTVLQALQKSAAEIDGHIEVLSVPMSPRRLVHFTEMARLSLLRPSGNTEAGALEAADPPTVLVADDHDVNRIVAEEMVRLLGYRVVSVESGEEAIAACEEKAPSMLLMDLNMPGMGGIEATRRLKLQQAVRSLQHFPIIAFSSDHEAQHTDDYGTAGFDGFLAKPVDIPAMRAALRQWANGP